MAARSWLTCLAVVTLCCVSADCAADELPVGVWKARAAGDLRGELVIETVKADGHIKGIAFGKRITGTWDGTKLSFKFSDVALEHWYEGWLVQEKRGKRNRYTLTGVRKQFTVFTGNDNYWFEVGGWYAQLDPHGKK